MCVCVHKTMQPPLHIQLYTPAPVLWSYAVMRKWEFICIWMFLCMYDIFISSTSWQNMSVVNTLRQRQMAAISQTTFSNAFSRIKMYKFRLGFHWNLFLRFELTIFQDWFILTSWWRDYCAVCSLGMVQSDGQTDKIIISQQPQLKNNENKNKLLWK